MRRRTSVSTLRTLGLAISGHTTASGFSSVLLLWHFCNMDWYIRSVSGLLLMQTVDFTDQFTTFFMCWCLSVCIASHAKEATWRLRNKTQQSRISFLSITQVLRSSILSLSSDNMMLGSFVDWVALQHHRSAFASSRTHCRSLHLWRLKTVECKVCLFKNRQALVECVKLVVKVDCTGEGEPSNVMYQSVLQRCQSSKHWRSPERSGPGAILKVDHKVACFWNNFKRNYEQPPTSLFTVFLNFSYCWRVIMWVASSSPQWRCSVLTHHVRIRSFQVIKHRTYKSILLLFADAHILSPKTDLSYCTRGVVRDDVGEWMNELYSTRVMD